jgi:hypothetical protein
VVTVVVGPRPGGWIEGVRFTPRESERVGLDTADAQDFCHVAISASLNSCTGSALSIPDVLSGWKEIWRDRDFLDGNHRPGLLGGTTPSALVGCDSAILDQLAPPDTP